MCKNVLPAYSSAKIIKIKRVFPQLCDHKCTATFFMNHSVYKLQLSSHILSVDKLDSLAYQVQVVWAKGLTPRCEVEYVILRSSAVIVRKKV